MNKDFLKTKKDIENWLNKYEIKNYTLIKSKKYGYVVDIDGHVNLGFKKLESIPVKFNIISGVFNCGYNRLTNLEFSPVKVGEIFSCTKNKIESLEFCPKEINGDFDCSHNLLTSLVHHPIFIKEDFYCNDNKIENLEFFPEKVGGKVDLFNNKKLKKLQKENNFNIIYQAHLDCVRELEYEKLNAAINNEDKIIRRNKI